MCKFNKKSAITFIAALFIFAIGTPHNGLAGYVSCPSSGQIWYESVTCTSGAISTGSYGSNCATRSDFCYGEVFQGQPTGRNVYKLSDCATCKSGYRLKEITEIYELTAAGNCYVTYKTCEKRPACEGLPCEGYTKSNPKDDPSNEGRQIYCNTSTNKCEYKCKNNYYNAARNKSSTSTIGTYCKTCPTNATCTNGEVKCPKDDYLSRIQTGSYYAFECNNCPAINGYDPHSGLFISGQTSSAIDSTNEVFDTAGAQTTITQCYIPNNAHITTKEGHEYRFKNNCYYDS